MLTSNVTKTASCGILTFSILPIKSFLSFKKEGICFINGCKKESTYVERDFKSEIVYLPGEGFPSYVF